MDAEWEATLQRPDVADLLALADARHRGTGPAGAAAVVDGTGAVLELDLGDETLPGPAGANLTVALNAALAAARDASQRYVDAHVDLADEVFDGDGVDRATFRAESRDGSVVATVDATGWRVLDLYLDDLDAATPATVGEAVSRAADEARGLPTGALQDATSSVLDGLGASLSLIEDELTKVDARLTSLEERHGRRA
ncbi:hypothetical protein [uncultured Tessaracoccus sp.]|uniref:hypothetical protein n=1 Tax=uncultured Tessaracoccus sp. TaxID=905023 RepID=UPI0025FFFAC2|nr:hypothetical protein [uncultured Tessaracoccus sp.]